MKGLISVCLVFTGLAVIGECRNIEGACPPSSGLAGICVFRPGINCISDSECGTGKKCCSEGCGRVCKTTVQQMHKGQCPVTEPIFTTCQFVPGVNCIYDSECSSNEKCCSHGCGKICKVSV
ncbi:hypothetical protein LOTGIDRAFT_159529 [Lottia gigantea]|uniref:WAP domain-containing protein n=1 Tax=Lottia gigantea TaxID=225164 RepID=V4A0Z7_LOTGI|nr:hypothetical protein LOTGIDRAFT_159529 [Lottia gigantea]ESO97488.1 hypothetical protein LOTGIDRAFT_159529 [Lottia gigantea]